MQILLKMSPALRKRIRKAAKAEGMKISEWVRFTINDVLKAKKFEGLIDAKSVEEILSEHSERQQIVLEEKLLERIDRAAQKKKMTRSDFILLSTILHAD